MEPLKPLSAESVPIFREGIYLTLSKWSALQIAVENEWGGPHSRDVPDQLGSNILDWFTKSKEPLYIDDLESLLDAAMDSLRTDTEDGSIEEVAEKLMIMHEECLDGNYTSVEKLRESCARRTVQSHVRQVVDDNDESDSDSMEEDDSSDMMVDVPKSQPTSVPPVMPSERPSTTGAPESEDGWVVVGSRKGKERKK